MLIQIIVSIFLILIIIKTLNRYQKKDLSLKETLAWLIVWVGTGIIFWFPQYTTKIANILGIGRGADLITYSSIIILAYLIFRIFIHLDKIEKNITKLTRKDTLDDVKKNEKN
jgi:small membrane protein